MELNGWSEELYNEKVKSKMFLSSIDNPVTGCVEWMGCLQPSGYGSISYKGVSQYVHRVAWIIENGEIPKGEGYHGTCVCHHCDNPRCINTDHMFIGSQTDNIKDRDKKGRGQGGKNQAKNATKTHTWKM